MNLPKQIQSVEFPSYVPDEEGVYLVVGGSFYIREDNQSKDIGPVTSITLQDDVPGLHCNLWSVKVWIENELVLEAPYTSVLYVRYK